MSSSRAERRQRERLASHAAPAEARGSRLFMVALIVLAVAIPLGIWYAGRGAETPANNEVRVPVLNAKHVADTSGVTYNSNPPTSGPHFTDWHKEWTFYETELPIGGLLHNMEHGGVVLFYQSSADETIKKQLESFTEDHFKMIASANDSIPAPMALAAWGVYELFDVFDEAAFDGFYRRNINRGPENVYP